jgi:spermidine synthase
MGDARLMLERESPQGYDIIAVDAFSSDSIPVHLLTREALELYFRHLKPDGVLAVHISNRYINLEPVLERGGNAIGKKAWVIDTDDNPDGTCYGTTWVLLSGREGYFQREEFQKQGKAPAPATWLKPWTDDFSNLYRLLK